MNANEKNNRKLNYGKYFGKKGIIVFYGYY